MELPTSIFEILCRSDVLFSDWSARSRELLERHPRLDLLWSGGIASTAVVTAFFYAAVSINEEFCIKNEEFCIKNEELCIKTRNFVFKLMNCARRWGA